MIKVSKLKKTYELGRDNKVHALKSVDFEIAESSIAALIGPSGSGKSTLLNILGGLDRDYDGHAYLFEKDIKDYNSNKYRRDIVQTIFQQFYLIPSLTVYENIMLPIKFGGQLKGRELRDRVSYILKTVGLEERKNHKPSELSGGQAQRVAIARALVPNPKVILADEPTGNLDSKTGSEVMELLFKINSEEKSTVIIITHDLQVIDGVKNRIHLKDGEVIKVDK